MPGKKSLPDVSQKVIADAEQYIAEFKRANRAQKSATAEMDQQLDKFSKGIKKKFELGDIGKDIFKGFGIGSGFAVAETAVELLASHFERAAKAAQDTADATERQLQNTRELIKLKQTDQQQLDTLNKEFAKQAELMADLQKDHTTIIPGMKREAGGGWIADPTKNKTVFRERTEEENAELKKQIELVGKLDIERQQLQDKVSKADVDKRLNEARAIATQSAASSKYERDYEGIAEAQARGAAAVADWNEEMRKSAEAFKENTEPALKFKKDIEEVNYLLKMGKMSATDAADAIATLNRQMDQDRTDRVDSALKNFFGEIDDAQKFLDESNKHARAATKYIEQTVNRSADAMSDAWVDAINGVEGAWGDLGTTVAREIEGIVAKVLIVTPIIHMLGSVLGGLGGDGGGIFGTLGAAFSNYGKPAAAGGYRDGSLPYLVGEDGPEVFNPGRAGTIVPNYAMGRAGAGGNIYNIDARGADAGAVERIQSALLALAGPGVVERRAMAATTDARRRGGM